MTLENFGKDLEENKNESDRAEFYKLQNGDNMIVLLTDPIGYSELFGIGIAYENCGYGQYASRRYKAYVKDLKDNKIKIANFSYTVAKKIFALSQGARTKFDGFPMPYSINLKTEKAGTKEVNTEVLAEGDYELGEWDALELKKFDEIQDIVDRLKAAQKKKVETDGAMHIKISEKIQAIEEQRAKAKAKKDVPTVQIGSDDVEELDTVEYPDEQLNVEDIPF